MPSKRTTSDDNSLLGLRGMQLAVILRTLVDVGNHVNIPFGDTTSRIMEKTLYKGLMVLEALIRKEGPCGVSDLAASLALSKSNTHRLLNTLVEAGFASVEGGRYTASLKTWELGMRTILQYDVCRLARPVLSDVAKRTGEGVRLLTLDAERMEVVYIDKIESNHAVRTFTDIGGRSPVHCTSGGKVLLAWRSPDVIKRASRKLKRYTEATITDPQEFIRHLEKVRRDGYAVNQREFSAQVKGISAPIFGADGSVVAALSIAAPAERFSNMVIKQCAELIREAAGRVSGALSFPASTLASPISPGPASSRQRRSAPSRTLRRMAG